VPPMPTDDHLHYHDPKNTPEEEEHSFDKLAKGLAAGTLTRGQVLKLAGAALLGSVFGGLFGLPAQAQSQRVGGGGGGRGAPHHHRHHHHHHHQGGRCPSGTTPCGKSCCTSSEVCSDKSCTACGAPDQPCCANSTCTASGTTCNSSGICVCPSGTPLPCGNRCCPDTGVNGTACTCSGETTEGTFECIYGSCTGTPRSCTSSSDCGPNGVCQARFGICFPLCSSTSNTCI
jgi:hypothetical protein